MKALQVVYALLTGAGAVTSIVGTRIYPMVLPEGQTTPAIVYEVVSSVRGGAIDAYADTHLTRARVQLNLLAADATTLLSLRDAVVQALQFQRGSIASATVHAVLFDAEGPDQFDDTLRLFMRPIDFIVHHEAD